MAHSLERFEDNFTQLKSKRGPYARHWAAQLAVSLGYGPVDEMPPKP